MIGFDVCMLDGNRVGSMEAEALPLPGDEVRVDEPGKQPVYRVIKRYFEPDNVSIIVWPADQKLPEQQLSPFAQQAPGASGFS